MPPHVAHLKMEPEHPATDLEESEPSTTAADKHVTSNHNVHCDDILIII